MEEENFKYKCSVSSALKMVKNAKRKGIIRSKEISLLNLTAKLIRMGDCLNLSKVELIQLDEFYFKLLDSMGDLVPELDFMENDLILMPDNDVYLWKESDASLSQLEIVENIKDDYFFEEKDNKLLSRVDDGFYFKSDGAGRINFFVMSYDKLEFIITDIDGNDVTSSFKALKTEKPEGVLITSKNVFAKTNIYLKIKTN